MSTPFEISDRLVEEIADQRPIDATFYGIAGRDHLWGDLSPEGYTATSAIARRYIAELTPHLDHPDEKQRVAARTTIADLEETIGHNEAGEHLIDLNHIYSPPQIVRDVFDVMDPEDEDGFSNIVTRLRTIDQPLAGYQECLEVGIATDQVVARRQVLSVIEQCRSLASEDSRFQKYVSFAEENGHDADEAQSAVDHARKTYGDLADWLEETYLPRAAPGGRHSRWPRDLRRGAR